MAGTSDERRCLVGDMEELASSNAPNSPVIRDWDLVLGGTPVRAARVSSGDWWFCRRRSEHDTSTTLADVQDDPTGIVRDGNALYWTNNGSGGRLDSLMRLTLSP